MVYAMISYADRVIRMNNMNGVCDDLLCRSSNKNRLKKTRLIYNNMLNINNKKHIIKLIINIMI